MNAQNKIRDAIAEAAALVAEGAAEAITDEDATTGPGEAAESVIRAANAVVGKLGDRADGTIEGNPAEPVTEAAARVAKAVTSESLDRFMADDVGVSSAFDTAARANLAAAEEFVARVIAAEIAEQIAEVADAAAQAAYPADDDPFDPGIFDTSRAVADTAKAVAVVVDAVAKQVAAHAIVVRAAKQVANAAAKAAKEPHDEVDVDVDWPQDYIYVVTNDANDVAYAASVAAKKIAARADKAKTIVAKAAEHDNTEAAARAAMTAAKELVARVAAAKVAEQVAFAAAAAAETAHHAAEDTTVMGGYGDFISATTRTVIKAVEATAKAVAAVVDAAETADTG